jgi:DNA adenine methylase
MGAPPLMIQAVGRTAAASPLRYPGGKAALAGFSASSLVGWVCGPPPTWSQYAGGPGAGIALLRHEMVQQLVINADPAVCCFWASVTAQPDRFAALIADTPLDVGEWRRQKQIYQASDESDLLTLGFAFFWLNRTNRSGIANAGPISGVNQDSTYKIDARFNRDQLVERVATIGALASGITVLGLDGMAVVARYVTDSSAFVYIDPRYVDTGGSLYLNAFTHRDNADLAAQLDRQRDGNWVVTYDPGA